MRYIALGDSISIDVYPAHDVQKRYAGISSSTKVGAVSLLHRNNDQLWPEFRGRDLATLMPGLMFDRGDDLTADAATTRTLLTQIEHVSSSRESTLITITAGGNDLLGEIGYRGLALDSLQSSPVDAIHRRLMDAVARLLVLRPNATILLSTVYDPSDGTNRLPGIGATLTKEAEWLRDYNDAIRRSAASDARLRLADIHAHFLGHGLTAPLAERWYLEESIIEPNARGASEVRRVWIEAIGA